MSLVVVGFGRVGQVCAQAIRSSPDLSLAAIVRRSESMGEKLPESFQHIPVVSQVGQLRDVQGAVVCVPTKAVAETVHGLLPHRVPIVECATLQGEALRAHKEAIHKLALRHGVPSVVGAGWDPGLLSVFRSWFALVTPGGATETKRHTGLSLRHTTVARDVSGVKDALCAERRTADGRLQRYLYVEVDKGFHPEKLRQALQADPLYLGEETQIFEVENIAALEEEGKGIVLERRGSKGRLGHHHFLLEARIDESVITAQVMIAAARALPTLKPGAYALADVPLRALWGQEAEMAEHDWS